MSHPLSTSLHVRVFNCEAHCELPADNRKSEIVEELVNWRTRLLSETYPNTKILEYCDIAYLLSGHESITIIPLGGESYRLSGLP